MVDRKPDAVRSPLGFAGPGDSSGGVGKASIGILAGPRCCASSCVIKGPSTLSSAAPGDTLYPREPRSPRGRTTRTNGTTEETEFSMASSSTMSELTEQGCRKHGAGGTPLILADGEEWLLASPTFRPRPSSVTQPPIDSPLDLLFDSLVLDEGIALRNVWEIAAALLRANYELTDEALSALLRVETGKEKRQLVAAVLDATFGSERGPRSYSRWVRASLLANGLGESDIPAQDLPDVLAVLVATNRTVPVSRFVDACQDVQERSALESLV